MGARTPSRELLILRGEHKGSAFWARSLRPQWRCILAQRISRAFEANARERRVVLVRGPLHHRAHQVVGDLVDGTELSRKKCAWAQAYYQPHCAKVQSHACALRCLDQRWLNILWRMWQTRTRYDESLHARNQVKHGSWVLQLNPS